VTPDSKWLDLLNKTTGLKLMAVAAAGGLFLLAIQLKIIVPISSGTRQLIQFGILVCTLLAVASWLEYFAVDRRFADWRRRVEVRREVRAYLPQMTERLTSRDWEPFRSGTRKRKRGTDLRRR
jgi:hypothetical protein